MKNNIIRVTACDTPDDEIAIALAHIYNAMETLERFAAHVPIGPLYEISERIKNIPAIAHQHHMKAMGVQYSGIIVDDVYKEPGCYCAATHAPCGYCTDPNNAWKLI